MYPFVLFKLPATNPLPFPLGTVWTLKYETLCYLGVLVAGLAGILARPRLALAALTTQREPGSQKPRDVLPKFDFGRKDLFLFRRSGKADMLCAGVNAQRHALLRFTGGDSKLNRERRSPPHHGLACLEQMPCPCRRARHQGPAAHVQNKYFQSISFADTHRFRLHGPKAGLTSFANVGRGLVPATPLLPLGAFNHRPQSVELGCTSHGAYTFPTNVAPSEKDR